MYENQGKDKAVRTMWKEKGQNIIEYALMLALVVGIGSFIYTQGYGDNISAVFNHAGNLLEEVNKTQEEAKKEAEKAAAREADRNYADSLGDLLKKAVSNGTITMGNGSSVSIFVQNQPNPKYKNWHMNGASTGSDVKVNGKNYINGRFVNMLEVVGDDYSNAEVKQDGVYWYGVQIKEDSTGNSYTLSYMDSNIDSYKNNYSGFDINQANAPYKTETWPPTP
ncbi:Flp family type IVb pilin [Dialister succinatiphilus]|uniref:Flp family type IVb pilin n=1 Tax=Dialister succinatiphilus TaxID=487173 RepID=UPI00402814E0